MGISHNPKKPNFENFNTFYASDFGRTLYHIIMYCVQYTCKQRRFRAFWKNCAEQKNCLFLCCKPVLKTLVKSEGLLEEPWKGGLGCQKTSFHEYFPYSKCLLKVQSTQSWSHGASVWGLIHQPTPFRLLILLVF